MRFTQVLYKRMPVLHWIYRAKWKEQGKMPISPIKVPPELQEMGVNIYDAREIVNISIPPPEPKLTSSAWNIPKRSSKIFYLFDNTTMVTEQEAQVGALTKTLCYEGLPDSLVSLIGADSIKNQDQLVQRAAMQALVRDGQMERLPKIVDPAKPAHSFPREYGTIYQRRAFSLMEKLSYIGEMGCGKYKETLKRKKMINAFVELPIERAGDKVTFQLLSDFLLTSHKPLEPFATPEEVESTRDTELPSIYPIKPTLDLTQLERDPSQNIQDRTSVLDRTSDLNVHTLHMVHKTDESWNPVQMLSRAVASCFCFAADRARKMYGEDVEEIPRPISLQCIFSDTKTFSFLAYQLNTLELDNDSGVKNLAWFDGPHNLYEDISEIKGIEGYNRGIFPKILAFYMNGAHPHSVNVSS